jgi:two-component system, OmpR family, alkaline phosphatase synthesis response regulator PhoP
MSVKPAKIMIVDDENDIIEFLTYNLKKEGHEVSSATDGQKALTLLQFETPDVIILDMMMPGMDGIEVCKEIRKSPKLNETQILFLTAQDDDFTQVEALEAGGDDFLGKPVKPKILTSRINVLLRRIKSSETETLTLKLGIFDIDVSKRSVQKHGKIIDLPKKEFEIMLLFAKKPGKVFGREEIFHKIWGNDVIVGSRTIDVHIRKLREKIGEDAIVTLKGVGYKFNEYSE